MFHELWGTKSQDCVHKLQPFWRERRAEAESRRGPFVLNRLTFSLAGRHLWYLTITTGKRRGCGWVYVESAPLSLTHTHPCTHTRACKHFQTYTYIHTHIQQTAENNHHLQVSQLLFTLLFPRALPEQSNGPFHKFLAGVCWVDHLQASKTASPLCFHMVLNDWSTGEAVKSRVTMLLKTAVM